MKSVFYLATLLLVSARADDDHGTASKNFNTESFANDVAEKPHFVMFFAPWCGHCKRLAPTWNDLAVKYNEKEDADVFVGSVDCTVETSLCSAQDVTGYPTLKFFKSGIDEGIKYRGQRDLESLSKFVEEQMGRGDQKDEEESSSEPAAPVVDNGLYILSEKSFKKHVETGDHFIKFYAPWCGHCQKLAPTWDELAKSYEGESHVKIGKLDCTQAQAVCQDLDVRGYPTLAYFRNGKKVEVYRGARTISELKDFVASMKEGGADKQGDKEPTEGGDQVATLKLDVSNFKDTLKEGLTFVKFFAPWCGHCKRLAPTWDQLSGLFASNDQVKIARVDCTSDDNKNKEICNEQGISGFPTLILYKNGEKVAEYEGKRDIDDLKDFVSKHLEGEKPKDEL